MRESRDIWSVLRPGMPPGTLPSPAPGTGPMQRDSGTLPGMGNNVGGVGSGSEIPLTQTPDDTGYGGGGDAVRIIPVDPREQMAHGQPITAERAAANQLRRLLQQHPPGPAVPRYNTLYDTLRTEDAWRVAADANITGTFTAAGAGNSTQQVAVSLPTSIPSPFLRLSQYPGGIQVYIYIRTFSALPSATTGTGVYDYFFSDAGGSSVPLGMYFASSGADLETIGGLCTTPITDAGGITLGTLYSNNIGIGGTPASVNWRIGITYVYLLPTPAFHGYSPDLPELRHATIHDGGEYHP